MKKKIEEIPTANKEVLFNCVRRVRRQAQGLARKGYFKLLILGSQHEGFQLGVERHKNIVLIGQRFDRQYQALNWSLNHGFKGTGKVALSIVPSASTLQHSFARQSCEFDPSCMWAVQSKASVNCSAPRLTRARQPIRNTLQSLDRFAPRKLRKSWPLVQARQSSASSMPNDLSD